MREGGTIVSKGNPFISSSSFNLQLAVRFASAFSLTVLISCTDSKASETRSVSQSVFALAVDGGVAEPETEGEHEHDLEAAGSAAPEIDGAMAMDEDDSDAGTDTLTDAGVATDPGTEHCTMDDAG